MLLSRYKMEVKLKRRLPRGMHVDHIDGNGLNDALRNLQVLTARENIIKSAKTGRKYVKLKCPVCGIVFARPFSQVQAKKMPVACSRTCGNKKKSLKLRQRVSNIIKHYIM